MANSTITLSEAVEQACRSWKRLGDSNAIVHELNLELNRPGSLASVIQWFIETRYATSGLNVPATTLINEYAQPAEIDEAFATIMKFIEELGKSGKKLGDKLKSTNRNLMNNYTV
jgi:hypothetical protein